MSDRRHCSPGLLARSGFTLIELLVAMTIVMILMVMITGMFMSNRKSYTVTEQVKRLEENTRVGIDFLSISIKQATQNAAPSIWIMDNDPAKNSAQTNASITEIKTMVAQYAGMKVKEGTDMLEIVTSLCPEPIKVEFNQQSAAMQNLPTPVVGACFDCDLANITTAKDVTDQCLEGLNATIRSEATGFTCYGEPTSGSNPNQGKITLTANRGNSASNTPDGCIDPEWTGKGNVWPAYIDFGYHYIYFVLDYTNPATGLPEPKLMRYRLNGVEPGEVVADFIWDMQLKTGQDTIDDKETNIDSWVDGTFYDPPGCLWPNCTIDENDTKAIRVSLLARTSEEAFDTKAPDDILIMENSGIVPVRDKRRQRAMVRTMRLRNKTY